jgi:hypothetical protein
LKRERRALGRLVERILTVKRTEPDAGTTTLACPSVALRGRKPKIDECDYRLCLPAPRLRQADGLTADEIKLVEENVS